MSLRNFKDLKDDVRDSDYATLVKERNKKAKRPTPNKYVVIAIEELMKKLDAVTETLRRELPEFPAYYRLNAAWRALDEAKQLLTP